MKTFRFKRATDLWERNTLEHKQKRAIAKKRSAWHIVKEKKKQLAHDKRLE